MAVWVSDDRGAAWRRERVLTAGSPFNHTYARRPVAAHAGFFAFWADGHGRKPSPSSLYYYDRARDTVFKLPRTMTADEAAPEAVR